MISIEERVLIKIIIKTGINTKSYYLNYRYYQIKIIFDYMLVHTDRIKENRQSKDWTTSNDLHFH